ncbi:MAG: hypothetical protein GY761_02555, partial [Hyphomicrobiales bacterium]|nr:hypothetical protein [Hyphomicrobiales bacterium]
FMGNIRVDITGFLFGDILAVTRSDIALIWIGVVVVSMLSVVIWRPLLAISVSREIAIAEGIRVKLVEQVFLLLLATVIALAIKVVGVLLITSLLVIPAATARRFSPSPELMALIAIALGLAAVGGGLLASLQIDSPAGPSIVVTMFVIRLASLIFKTR